MLEKMTIELRDVKRVHEKTPCTPASVTSDQFLNINFGGLQPAQYVCYDEANHQHDYLQCSTSDLASLGVTCTTNEWDGVIEAIRGAVDSRDSGDGIVLIDDN